ncbi:MAG: diguanylate cyclase [Deltaproteobacteria bacterium]|nr:MAG: diguanylate cyclase [Deltaproteobacteria bacterium]
MDLKTSYLGLDVKNPLIASSSGLTSSADKVKKLEDNGIGAVVLKSIFEEEIAYEYSDYIKEASKNGESPKYFEYEGRQNPIDFYGYVIREENLQKYTRLIENCKKSVDIPVIASINCHFYSSEWIAYARQLERAGADALELNMFFLPTNFSRSREETEKIYFNVIEQVLSKVSIPVSLKISYFFTDLGPMIQKISETGIKGLVLFNRFFSPDFDIEKFKVIPSFVMSNPADLAVSLRWIAVMSQRVGCDLAASTGVHNGDAVIKQILAGADAVQVASCLYKNGVGYVKELLERLDGWMAMKGFNSIDSFKGKMSQDKNADTAIYERVQFMKYFGGQKI